MNGQLLLTPESIRREVERLGAELSSAYDDGVVLVGLLDGGVVFLADLVRCMTISPVVDFLAVSSYAEGTGRVRLVKDLDTDVDGLDVVLVDAVLDTGLTASYLVAELRGRGARSVALCALVDKQRRRVVPVDVRFRGVTVDEDYVVGYGLDHGGRFRNLPGIARFDPLAP